MFTLATDLVVGSVPAERAGAASAISETSSEFGGALGIAIFGSIGTALYRAAMSDVVSPGLAPEQMEAARSTLGAASAIAQELPGAAGAALLDAARQAFVHELHFTAAVGTVALVGMAGLATRVLRTPDAGVCTEPRTPDGAQRIADLREG